MPAFTFEVFEIELQNTLHNLSDPAYLPEDCIFQILEIQPPAGIDAVRTRLIDMIERGAQGDAASDTAKITFLYKVLQQRFIKSLSQERAAELLDISARHLRRKQSEAIRALAIRLWKQSRAGDSSERDEARPHAPDATDTGEPPADPQAGASWAELVLREIEVLNSRSPGTITTDLSGVLQKTIEMARRLYLKEGVSLEMDELPEGVEVAVHPVVLRQVVLYIVRQAVQEGFASAVSISAREEPEQTAISFMISQAPGQPKPLLASIDELARVLGGKAEIRTEDQCCLLDLVFPKSRKVTVLIVDDNYETVQLFRRFALNSRFEIHHSPSGLNLLNEIRQVKAEILVIDVLLPGQDGWDLLVQIRSTPETAALPVIVSSVLGDAEIARSLGANFYLPKPVDQKTFLRTLQDAAGFTKA